MKTKIYGFGRFMVTLEYIHKKIGLRMTQSRNSLPTCTKIIIMRLEIQVTKSRDRKKVD